MASNDVKVQTMRSSTTEQNPPATFVDRVLVIAATLLGALATMYHLTSRKLSHSIQDEPHVVSAPLSSVVATPASTRPKVFELCQGLALRL